MLNFKYLKFHELTNDQLYEILALRADIFVVEQQCPYLDPDGKDQLAIHLLGTENQKLVVYARVFPPVNNHVVFGRIVTDQSARGKGYGKLLMQEVVNYCEKYFSGIQVKCSAQFYLKKFYESFGFVAQGEVYSEDNIPHIAMYK